MTPDLQNTIALLTRTPASLQALLAGLPENWTAGNEGAGTWTVVEVLGHDASTPGVASAGPMAIYVSNQGDGQKATDEEQGLAAIALARHLSSHAGAGSTWSALPTLSERARLARSVAPHS